MKKIIRVIGAMSVLLASHFSFADTASCEHQYTAKQFERALDACRNASINGEPRGKYFLGLMYLNAEGTQQNLNLSLRLIKEAAQLGDADALIKIASMYQAGRFVEKSQSRACDWWANLAGLGNDVGQEKIGVCYLMGRGRDKDIKMGYAYLSLAAESGNSAAKYIVETYGDRFPSEVKEQALQLAKVIKNK